MCNFVAHTSYISCISLTNYVSHIYMNHVFRYFMNYLKSLTTTQNYLNYFKDNIFSTFFFQICKDGSFKTSKTKNKQLKNSTNNFKRINIFVNEIGRFEKKN